MNAVGRLGSYISRGVYTVSGPFHPFGGCVDIIVVEQQDGSFKSSPWYVRFGKFQGVLKTREKVVNICVNGVEANFHMYLDHKGEAYFLKEVDVVEEGEPVLNHSSSGDDEIEGQSPSGDQRALQSKSCNFDVGSAKAVGQITRRTNSHRSQILGRVFGRRSMKENDNGEVEKENGIDRADSLERAEFAAKLLEVKWSTNLDTTKPRKDNASIFSSSNVLDGQARSDLEIDGQISHVSLSEKCAETSTLAEMILETECEVASNVNGYADESITTSVALSEENEKGVCSENVGGYDLQVPMEIEVGTSEGFNEEEVSDSNDGYGISRNGGMDTVQPFMYCKSSGRSIVKSDASSEQTHETLYIASGGYGDLQVHAETLHAGTELLAKDTFEQHLEDFHLEAPMVEGPNGHLESYAQIVHTNQMGNSGEEVEPRSLCSTSSFTNSFQQLEDEETMKVEDSTCRLQPSSESEITEAINVPPSVSLDEEELVFGNIDEFKSSEIQRTETKSAVDIDIENFPSWSPEGTKELDNDQSQLSLEKFDQENPSTDSENSTGNMRVASSPIGVARSHKPAVKEVGRLAESLPIMWSQIDGFGAHDIHCLSHSLDSNSKPLNWTMQSKDNLSFILSDEDKEHKLAVELPDIKGALLIGELKDIPSNPAIGDPSKASISPSGNWRLWPFSFRRSRSHKALQPVLTDVRTPDTAENALEIKISVAEAKNIIEGKVVKKMVRVLSPTSEQIASLNLKEGRNTVTFTFLTPMLGRQQVDASIYLWKWNTRVVISDVDGTITRSDVLGQFMPLVGVDWSHLGVVHLFSAIKENGYQFLYLSARSISQAYLTRQFLFNLKQDGKALPDGPVVISPDGLFPSLYREVIRRAPHEFKISCLEEIRSLFPSDYNPFYAGFGNRDTDEVSYLKVGIPKGKIFIINPKGEVAVNRRLDTKSYKSIHALVNGMFPPVASFEQEDFNSWNFWKLPPPMIDD